MNPIQQLMGGALPKQSAENQSLSCPVRMALWTVAALALALGTAVQPVAALNGQNTPSAPTNPSAAASSSSTTPEKGKKKSTAEANPFPEDTAKVPVMPTGDQSPAQAEGEPAPELPTAAESDPVRTPEAADLPAPATGEAAASSSSSLNGLDGLIPSADAPEKKRKLVVPLLSRRESASKDVEVGKYYLDRKNWRAALSRFQSALVLNPEETEVYWGMAEAERHLNQLAEARANYRKLVELDPESPHARAAHHALEEAEIANAVAKPPAAQPAAGAGAESGFGEGSGATSDAAAPHSAPTPAH